MKKIKNLLIAVIIGSSLSSCYTYTNIVGTGAQGSEEISKWNSYFLYGLITGEVADANSLSGGASNYEEKVQTTFVNALIGGITFGIYTPTTTTVKK